MLENKKMLKKIIRVFHKGKRKLEVAPIAQSWNNMNAKIEYECKPLGKK